jgi:hypothetical protein
MTTQNNTQQESTSEFYENLLSQQKPLGEEFSKVLFNNLWDLYEEQA